MRFAGLTCWFALVYQRISSVDFTVGQVERNFSKVTVQANNASATV